MTVPSSSVCAAISERVGPALAIDDERVVARNGQRAGDAGKHALAVMADARCLAVHGRIGANDCPTERHADRLMPETDTEQRRRRAERSDHVEGDAGLLRTARAPAK